MHTPPFGHPLHVVDDNVITIGDALKQLPNTLKVSGQLSWELMAEGLHLEERASLHWLQGNSEKVLIGA